MLAAALIVVAALLLAYGLVAWIGAERLTRRRPPDPPASPADLGLPYEDVRFAARDDLGLGGVWIPPPDAASDAAVLICPGYNGSLDSDIPYALPLRTAGYGVLLIDLRAHGRSAGDWVTLGDLERFDVLGAVDWLVQQGVRRVALLGFSMGAGTAINAAPDHPAIVAVIADGAYTRPLSIVAGGLRERYSLGRLTTPLAWGMLRVAAWRIGIDLRGATPLTHVRAIAPRPLFLIHGARDTYVSMNAIRRLYREADAPKSLWVIPEAGHRETDSRRPDEWRRRVLDFLATHVPVKEDGWTLLATPPPPPPA